MNTRMAYSGYWLTRATQHVKEFTGDKPLSSIDLGRMIIGGALSEMVASAMAKAFEHVEEQADNERIKALGGHRNSAGGWCSPEHGNTCGFHPEFDGREREVSLADLMQPLNEIMMFDYADDPTVIDGSELIDGLPELFGITGPVVLNMIPNSIMLGQALHAIQDTVNKGKPLKIMLEHAVTDDGAIVVDITVEHGPNQVFSDVNFADITEALTALAKHLQEVNE